MSTSMPPDDLNEIGVLKRREIEARIRMPVLEALGAEFGRSRVLEVARRMIVDVARTQGPEPVRRMGGDSLGHFAAALEDWKTVMEGAPHRDYRFELQPGKDT
jgi:hypothetical protein